MSAPISTALFAARAAADAKQQELADGRLVNFLARLIAAEIPTTDWEERFCTDILYRHALRRQAGHPAALTTGQRDCIAKLVKAYGPQMPVPKSEARSPKAELPEAAPGTCGWTLREDGRVTRCGKKAVVRSPRGMEFCQEHHEVRLAWRKRQKEMRGRP